MIYLTHGREQRKEKKIREISFIENAVFVVLMKKVGIVVTKGMKHPKNTKIRRRRCHVLVFDQDPRQIAQSAHFDLEKLN